jgi:hypothetical protein
VEHLDDDRPLFDDINRVAEVVVSGEILKAVENEIGALDNSELEVTSERYAF